MALNNCCSQFLRKNIRYSRNLFNVNKVQKMSLSVCEQENGIREIILDDPKTRNSLSMNMMNSLEKNLCANLEDKTLRCIVLSAKGKVFSAGHNLKELTDDKGYENHRSIFAKCSELINIIQGAPVPVIAKVNGLVAAAGLQLVCSCDIVISSDKSTFSTPGVNFGLYCSTPGIALARVAPHMKASYMLLTAAPITAQEAYISGIVSKVVEERDLDKEVEVVLKAIKQKSRQVVQLGKAFYYNQRSMPLSEAYKIGADVMASNLTLRDGKEGILSFIEKRKPVWES